MAGPIYKDRVMETSTTIGTGTYTLLGAVTGYQSFSAIGNGNSCFYCAVDVDNNGIPIGGWEVNLGTYTSSGTTLSRTTTTASSNSGSAVSWAAGTRRIFVVAPSQDFVNGSGIVHLSSGTYSVSAVVESDITLANNTTNDVSTSAHGFAPKAPNDATKYLDGTGAYSTPTSSGGGGGSLNATYTGAAGSEPGSPVTGDLYLPNNGSVIERYSGSAWSPWGPIFPFTAPDNTAFAWINQGTATVSTTNGGIILSDSNANAQRIRLRKITAPATPYTITIAFIPTAPGYNSISMGLAFRQSSDGKLATCELVHSSGIWKYASEKFTDPSTFSATYTTLNADIWGPVVWLRAGDNGTNRTCEFSNDGINWLQFHSVGRTDFLTANEIGFYINSNSAANTPALSTYMWLQHWKQA